MKRPLPGPRLAAVAALLGLGLSASPAWADAPQINGFAPAGLPRGVATEVMVTGANLAGNPRLVAPIPLQVDPPEKPEADAGKWKVKVTAPADLPAGVYPIRVVTDDGISAPFLLHVAQLPTAAETEPNSTFAQAQVVNPPTVVEGQAAGNDVDYFKFRGRKGQRIVIDALCARVGSGIDPQVRLMKADQSPVASEDDTPGLMTDARLTVELPEDGEYVVEISDSKYATAGRPVYRLTIGEVPAPLEVYPLGGRRGETIGLELRGGTLPAGATLAAAARVTAAAPEISARPRVSNHALGIAGPSDPTYDAELLGVLDVSDLPELREPSDPAAPPVRAAAPVVLNGRIDPAGDEDRFSLAVAPGQKLRVAVHAADLGSALDGTLQVLNPTNGQAIASADDVTVPPIRGRGQNRNAPGLVTTDPSLEFTVPAGLNDVTLALKDLGGRGGPGFGYRIVVEPADPAFNLEMAEAQVSVPRGGTVAVPVTVGRQGYTGPIRLEVANLPAGLTARVGAISDGQPTGVLSLTAAPDAGFGPVNLEVVGRADGPAGPMTERATKQIVYVQQANLPIQFQTQTGLAAAPAQPRAARLETPEAPVEAVHGYPATFPLKVVRQEGGEGALAFTPLPLPPGLAVPEVKVDDKGTEATVTVNVAPEAALGKVSIGLNGKGKLGGKDLVLAAPVTTLEVARPVAVELAAPKFEIKPGETFELKGKLNRKAPFKQPVKVQLNGLPAGLKADPIDLAAEATEFTIKVVADAGAAAAEATAQLALAFKLGDKDYAFPPTPVPVKLVK